MPKELYEQVKDEIPKGIGVYTAYQYQHNPKHCCFECVKKPARQELRIPHDKLMFAFMQALSRENQKYRRMLRKEWESKFPEEKEETVEFDDMLI
jgi:hypothetical protein